MSVSITEAVTSRAGARTILAAKINDDCSHIGGIYRLDYHSALVLTDDYRKSKAGGVPQGGFLLAAAGAVTPQGFLLDDQEIILLRVKETAPLPNEAELVQTRLAVVRDASTTGRGFDEVADVLTRGELQQSAFDCEVIGTFYESDQEPGLIEFGADIDNVVSSARYQVFLPSTGVLSWLASYSESTDESDLLPLGVVRFASTLRRAREAHADQAPVFVHVSDFIGRKTAVFGMTRTGKSNTIKTLVTAIHSHAHKTQRSIGQLVFDPQGEYANVNQQDQTGLRMLGDADTVRIYRFGATGDDSQVRPMGMNFYDVGNLSAVAEFVGSAVADQYGSYAYVKNFISISWEEPPFTAMGDWSAWSRARVGLYGLLSICGFRGDSFVDHTSSGTIAAVRFQWKKEDYEDFSATHPGLVYPPASGSSTIYSLRTPRAAREVTLYMAAKGSWNTSSRNQKDTRPFGFIAEVLDRASVKAAIRTLTDFHSTASTERIEDQVWADMQAGRLAIIDLSFGAGEAPRIISENVVTHLLNEASARFRSNQDAIQFQIVVEEAHNLFERSGKDVAANPWVRLSKEAAKYRIGLVYATQEVSSVDQRILSNTSNWLVAHLNSDNETRELSHYYDFKTWADSIRKCEDVGFVRMKTYSGKYIVPVQVARFDHTMISAARQAAALNPVDKAE
jgi:hypothetical protein